jgi:mRNA interferase RelE/StbE
MRYKLLILRRAQKELSGLPVSIYEKTKSAVYKLAEEPKSRGCKKLSGREGWRIRVGDYRIIYEIDEKLRSITVLHIGHRKDVYK